MFHRLDIVYYWYSDMDPSENNRESLQQARCTCTFCAGANDRAIEESMYGTPHLLDYWNDRCLTLKHGDRVNNGHILKALEILLHSYRKVLQPVRLECLSGAKVKSCIGYDPPDVLSGLIPPPVYNSLYNYVIDSKHSYGNYAKRHEDVPSDTELDSLPILQKHVKKYIVTKHPYMFMF